MRSNLYLIIESRLNELEILLIDKNYSEANLLIPHLSKFFSILTEEQRDFLNAAKVAVEDGLEWK